MMLVLLETWAIGQQIEYVRGRQWWRRVVRVEVGSLGATRPTAMGQWIEQW